MRNLTVFMMVVLLGLVTAACSASADNIYTPEKAKKHGDVVSFGAQDAEQVDNLNHLFQFVDNVSNGKSDTVQIAIFDKSNNATVNKLKYDGDSLTMTTKKPGTDQHKTFTCKGIKAEDSGFFMLSGCKKPTDEITVLGVSSYTYKKAKLNYGG